MNSATTRPRLWRWIFGTLFIVTTWQVLGLALTFLLASYFDLDVVLLFFALFAFVHLFYYHFLF